jgi:hypothetical protein
MQRKTDRVRSITQWLEDEPRRVMLYAVKILASRLPGAHDNPFVEPSLFNPPGVEPEGICTGSLARVESIQSWSHMPPPCHSAVAWKYHPS